MFAIFKAYIKEEGKNKVWTIRIWCKVCTDFRTFLWRQFAKYLNVIKQLLVLKIFWKTVKWETDIFTNLSHVFLLCCNSKIYQTLKTYETKNVSKIAPKAKLLNYQKYVSKIVKNFTVHRHYVYAFFE